MTGQAVVPPKGDLGLTLEGFELGSCLQAVCEQLAPKPRHKGQLTQSLNITGLEVFGHVSGGKE